MSFLRSLLLALLALRLLGGDVAVLQVAAWGGMIASRSAQQGLAEAVASTLDGDHPCPRCLALQDARQTDQPLPASPRGPPTKLKLHDLIPSEPLALLPPLSPHSLTAASPSWRHLPTARRSDAPPVPPPQLS